MKKIVLLAFLLFLTNISPVFAYEQATRSCIYQKEGNYSSSGKSWQNYLDVTYMGLGTGMPMLGEINYYKLYSDNTKETIFSYDAMDATDYYINWNKGIPGMPTEYSYFTEAIITQKMDEVTTSDDVSLICPSNIYILEYTDKTGIFNQKIETKYDLYACGNNYGDYNNDTCQMTWDILRELRKTANHDGSAGSLYDLEYYTGTVINNVGQTQSTTTNVQDKYNETQGKIEKYCEEGTTTYNKDECLKANLEQEQYVGQAEDQGVSEETLKKEYMKYTLDVDIDLDISDGCESYLGNPEYNPNLENQTPAYYLQFIFNLIKYVALVLLFVMTIIDFVKATTSSKDDAIKKATISAVKRLIIAVIIFFLPLLIEFILTLLGVYSAGTCGIS